MATAASKKLILNMLNEIESLSIHVVEEWLEPEQVRNKLARIRTLYEEEFTIMSRKRDHPQKIAEIFQECLEELQELEQVIIQEQSVPDVVQEYLAYMVGGFRNKLFKEMVFDD